MTPPPSLIVTPPDAHHLIRTRDGVLPLPADSRLSLPTHLAVSTDSLRFALTTLHASPPVPPLEDAFVADMVALAEAGLASPLEYVARRIQARDPVRACVFRLVVVSIRGQEESSDTASSSSRSSEPKTPVLSSDDHVMNIIDTCLGEADFDAEELELDAYLRSLLTKYAPTALHKLDSYASASKIDKGHARLSRYGGRRDSIFGHGYGYGAEMDVDMGYDARYHSARW